MSLTAEKLCGALGAEVSGIDLRQVTADQAAEIAALWAQHLVLVFRDQHLEAGEQVAFTSHFGPVEEHPLKSRPGVDGHPAVLVLENRPGKAGSRNDIWHSDISFAGTPPLGSVLHARIIPGEGRGDTQFCNMIAAYEGLSDGLKASLLPMRAAHSAAALAARNNAAGGDANRIEDVTPPALHPVVRLHESSGRPALFVNPWFTTHFDGMTPDESRTLLDVLVAEATRHENIYRHRWRAGDVVMWDNRAAMHYAVRDYDETMPRLMFRTTAAGERPRAYA